MKSFKEIWYERNPVHENNSDTGEDMFWKTAQMVAEEFCSQSLSTETGQQGDLLPFSEVVTGQWDYATKEAEESYPNDLQRMVSYREGIFKGYSKALKDRASQPQEGQDELWGEWQRCPICEGGGEILADGYTSSVFQQCPTCSGNRIIQRPLIKK